MARDYLPPFLTSRDSPLQTKFMDFFISGLFEAWDSKCARDEYT